MFLSQAWIPATCNAATNPVVSPSRVGAAGTQHRQQLAEDITDALLAAAADDTDVAEHRIHGTISGLNGEYSHTGDPRPPPTILGAAALARGLTTTTKHTAGDPP